MDDLATPLAEGTPPPRACARCSRPSSSAAPPSSARKRSGYEQPVLVAVGPADGALRAVAPAAPALRADPDAVNERTWLLVAALVGALVEVAGAGSAARAGTLGGHLAFDVRRRPRRRRARAAGLRGATSRASTACGRARVALPAGVLADVDDLRAPIGAAHPLVVAARVAALGGRPADPRPWRSTRTPSCAALDARRRAVPSPHDDPDPARRVARRILQRLDGMGKWGGYHTEFAHLARGFAGNERALAEAVGEALLASGLLAEKPSVGQRHVFLNPRRAGDIHALIERGEAPRGPQVALAFVVLNLLSQVTQKLFTARTLAEAGILRPTRPDKALRIANALRRWGPTPAAGYTAAAIRDPDATAIIDELGTLTFEEVHRRTNALAHSLSDAGVKEGDGVAIMCRNHRGFIDATVACSKLGAHALYLNTAFAGPQITDVVEREKPVALVYDEEFEGLTHDAGERRKRFIAWHDGDDKPKDPLLEDLIAAGRPRRRRRRPPRRAAS